MSESNSKRPGRPLSSNPAEIGDRISDLESAMQTRADKFAELQDRDARKLEKLETHYAKITAPEFAEERTAALRKEKARLEAKLARLSEETAEEEPTEDFEYVDAEDSDDIEI